MKDLIKKIYYKFSEEAQLLAYTINLGYVFHVEKVYSDDIFEKLILFCKEFQKLTNTKPICAIIPPTNLLLKMQMSNTGFSEKEFISRIHKLSDYATIGYHGHFYLAGKIGDCNAIHCNSFNQADLIEQFSRDVKWFEQNSISHNHIYTGGWWFINEEVIKLLIKHKFKYDFSFSQAKFFYNQFSNAFMKKNNIQPGESFNIFIGNEKEKLLCIQNFIAMHTTKFPQDFDRNMKSLLNKNYKENITGVVNSHDYDLNIPYTIKCIKYQININKVKFIPFEQLIAQNYPRTISFKAALN